MSIFDWFISKQVDAAVREQLAVLENENTFLVGARSMSQTDRDRFSYDRTEVIEQSLTAWRTNPIAHRIVELTSQYVVGGGLTINCKDKAASAFFKQFWSHRLNRMPVRVAEMCDALTASKLPAPVVERLRVQFTGVLFETDDLLGAPREEAAKDLKVAKLSGIRELYLMLTGDYDLHGSFDSERVQFALTTDFTGLVKNALNKIVLNTWEQLGQAGYDWWNRISRVEHFNSLQGITGTLVGTVGTLPTVAEGAEYTELAIGDSPETASFTKYGGYIPLTLELIDRDESRKLAAYPRELAAAGLRKISALVAAIFTDNSGVGPTMADTGALFNATAVTTAGGHANLLTTALAAAEWDVVSTAMYDQPMLIKQAAGYYGTGPKMAINPRFAVVPRALQLAAMKILYPTLENAANIYSENLQRGQPGDVVTVPGWTDANNWAAVADPLIAPAIFVGERFGIMPEIFIAGDNLSPAVFMNDEHRLKVRHFLAVWVNDFRPLHKSKVA